jgi:hypothetical protein
VFALIPIFWLFRRDGRRDFKTWCVAICYVALTNPLLELLSAGGHVGIIQSVMLLSWTPLILAVFAYVVEQRKSLQAGSASFHAT